MAESNDTNRVKRYPCYRAQGTHRHLGQQHGEQAGEQIRAHLDYLYNSMKLTRDELRSRALHFQPLFNRFCPHLLDEIRGLAEGAGVDFAEALATNLRGALDQATDGGCTAFVVSGRGTSDGGILIGQNCDMPPALINFSYVLHLKPKDKPEALIWTFGGMTGYHGINSHGVGHFANDLGGGPKPRHGMPHYPLKRLILECASLDEIETVLGRVPVCVNGNYVLCDGHGRILDVETTTEGPHSITDNGEGFIAHSNHFICPEHATSGNFKLSAADSFPRLVRMNQLIESRFGRLRVDDFKSFLRDRHGGPTGICRFAQTDDPKADWTTSGMTVASIIAEPHQRRLHVAVGNLMTTPFVVYHMDES